MTQDETTRAFLDLLDQIRDRDRSLVFSDFLEVSAMVVGHMYLTPRKRKDAAEKFTETFKTYCDPEKAQDIMFEMFKLINEAHLKTPFEDVFGPIYMEIVSPGSKTATGQVFTPESLCMLMGAMLFDKKRIEDAATSGKRITVSDPCCGSGGQFFSAARTIWAKGYSPQEKLGVYAADIDRKCCLMTYIQLAIEGIPAHIEHKDTLRTEAPWDTWEIPYVLHAVK